MVVTVRTPLSPTLRLQLTPNLFYSCAACTTVQCTEQKKTNNNNNKTNKKTLLRPVKQNLCEPGVK